MYHLDASKVSDFALSGIMTWKWEKLSMNVIQYLNLVEWHGECQSELALVGLRYADGLNGFVFIFPARHGSQMSWGSVFLNPSCAWDFSMKCSCSVWIQYFWQFYHPEKQCCVHLSELWVWLGHSWWNPCSLRILWCGSWISWADKIWIVDYFVVLVCEALVISPPIWLLCHRFGDKIALIQLLPNKQLCFQLDLLGHIWVRSCIANLSKGSYEQRPQCLHSIFGQCQLVRMWAGFNLLCLQTHLVFQC